MKNAPIAVKTLLFKMQSIKDQIPKDFIMIDLALQNITILIKNTERDVQN